jgi:hypothetical protein
MGLKKRKYFRRKDVRIGKPPNARDKKFYWCPAGSIFGKPKIEGREEWGESREDKKLARS